MLKARLGTGLTPSSLSPAAARRAVTANVSPSLLAYAATPALT